MSLKGALEMVKNAFNLRNADDSEIVKLVVDGKNEDDAKEILDILKDRVICQVEVDPGTQRRLKYGVRRNGLLKAWDDTQDEVKEYASE
jgi:hypothetical protein